jgi:hypothetical protein
VLQMRVLVSAGSLRTLAAALMRCCGVLLLSKMACALLQ